MRWMGLSVLAFTGCSGFADGKSGLWDTAEADADTDVDTSDTAFVDVAGWRLSGSLMLVAGEPALEKSSLVVGYFDSEGVEQCNESLPASAASVAELPSDELLSWWALELKKPEKKGCGAYLAPYLSGVELGVGEMHGEIRARLDQVGIVGPAADTLNGAYLRISDLDELWVFGVAGLPDAYGGLVGPAATAPLDDGPWEIRTVVPLPM